jgi:hypothetical protein
MNWYSRIKTSSLTGKLAAILAFAGPESARNGALAANFHKYDFKSRWASQHHNSTIRHPTVKRKERHQAVDNES